MVAWSGFSSGHTVRGWVSPGDKHLQLLPKPPAAEGPRARCQGRFGRSAWPSHQRGQAETRIPARPKCTLGSSAAWQHPTLVHLLPSSVPPAPGCGAGQSGRPRPQQPVAASLKPPSPAGEDAGPPKLMFLPRSYRRKGRSQPGTAEPGQITYSFSWVSGQSVSARRRLPACGMFTSKPRDLAMLPHGCGV